MERGQWSLPSGLSILAVVGAALGGCGDKAAQKTLIIQCDPKAPGSECADKSALTKPPRKDPSETTPSGATTFAPSPKETKTNGDSTPKTDPPVDDPFGGDCKALQSCCDALRRAGFTGSADQCDRAVAAGIESTCRTTYEDNRKPSDESDFVCE